MTALDTNTANFWKTKLTSVMGPTDLEAFVETTAGLSSPAYLVIEPEKAAQREIILMDGSWTATKLACTSTADRYLTGSAAASGLTHPAGSAVWCVPLGQHLDDLHDRIDGFASDVTTERLTLKAGGSPTALVYGAAGTVSFRNSADNGYADVDLDDITVRGQANLIGAINHDGSTVGFYGVAPATRPAAITQTYSTASRTVAVPTAANPAAITAASPATTAATVATADGSDPATTQALANALKVELNKLITDVAAAKDELVKVIADATAIRAEVVKLVTDLASDKQNLTAVIDDLQTLGLEQ